MGELTVVGDGCREASRSGQLCAKDQGRGWAKEPRSTTQVCMMARSGVESWSDKSRAEAGEAKQVETTRQCCRDATMSRMDKVRWNWNGQFSSPWYKSRPHGPRPQQADSSCGQPGQPPPVVRSSKKNRIASANACLLACLPACLWRCSQSAVRSPQWARHVLAGGPGGRVLSPLLERRQRD